MNKFFHTFMNVGLKCFNREGILETCAKRACYIGKSIFKIEIILNT